MAIKKERKPILERLEQLARFYGEFTGKCEDLLNKKNHIEGLSYDWQFNKQHNNDLKGFGSALWAYNVIGQDNLCCMSLPDAETCGLLRNLEERRKWHVILPGIVLLHKGTFWAINGGSFRRNLKWFVDDDMEITRFSLSFGKSVAEAVDEEKGARFFDDSKEGRINMNHEVTQNDFTRDVNEFDVYIFGKDAATNTVSCTDTRYVTEVSVTFVS